MVLYVDPGTGGVIVNFLIAIITSIVYFYRKLFFDKINFDLLKKSEILNIAKEFGNLNFYIEEVIQRDLIFDNNFDLNFFIRHVIRKFPRRS